MTCNYYFAIMQSLASNLILTKEIAVVKVIFSEQEKELERVRRRMDRFDAVVAEYLRSNRKTVEYLSKSVGCDPSSLWRYRRKEEYFKKAPLDVVCGCLRMANVSNENLRYILGLPTGRSTADEN